jgi:hypothetical protein
VGPEDSVRDSDLWAGRFSRPAAPVPRSRRWRSVAVAIDLDPAAPPRVRYGWDAETEILTACIEDRREGGWPSTSVTLAGTSGAWVTLDLRGGRFCGLEVAVWPPVELRAVLPAPRPAASGHARCPEAAGGPSEVEVDVELRADRDRGGRTVRLGVGPPRASRPVRVARDIMLDVDDAGALAGVWLLNVPPLPLTA